MTDRPRVKTDRARAMEYHALGHERMRAGDYGNAENLLSAALDADPDCPDAVLDFGVIAGQHGNHAVQIACMRRVIALGGNNRSHLAAAWSNLGNHLNQILELEAAEEALTTSLEIEPDHFSVHHNIGLVYYNQGRAEEAVEHLRRAIELQELAGLSSIGARSDLSMALMKSGRLHEGLVLNECRWEGQLLEKLPAWQCGLPMWGGESLSDKTIFIHAEQGFGDSLQWCRYLPELKVTHGAERVIFAVPKNLITFFQGQDNLLVDDVFDMHNIGDLVRASREADYHVPLLSVVKEIGVDFEGLPEKAAPYLRPVTSPIGRRTPPTVVGSGLRVGLIWEARPNDARGRQKSVGLEDMLVLAEVPGVRLYSLQVGQYRNDIHRLGATRLVADLGEQIDDFASTSEIMAQLDLIVSVDTGPMHLAAAMGLPTWLLQPLSRCWRWCYGAKVWYGCVDEYFQKRAHSWSAPISQMKKDLTRLAMERT